MAGTDSDRARPPGGYRFLRLVLIVGAIGFAIIGSVYLINGQLVPGIFALFLAAIEAAALPLFRKLLETSRPPGAGAAADPGSSGPASANARRSVRDQPPPR